EGWPHGHDRPTSLLRILSCVTCVTALWGNSERRLPAPILTPSPPAHRSDGVFLCLPVAPLAPWLRWGIPWHGILGGTSSARSAVKGRSVTYGRAGASVREP